MFTVRKWLCSRTDNTTIYKNYAVEILCAINGIYKTNTNGDSIYL